METLVFSLFFVIIIIGLSILGINFSGLNKLIKQQQQQQKPQTPVFKVDLRQTEKMIEQIPNKVLHSIQSSANGYKGNLGELMGFLRLGAEYDKVIPLGDIVDYIGLVYPTNNKEGKIVFIDIKTGKARLSKDQRLLKDIIEKKNIEFQKYNISISDLSTGEK